MKFGKLVLTSRTSNEPFKNDEDPHPGFFGVHPSHKTSLILCLFSGVLSLCFGCGNLFAETVTVSNLELNLDYTCSAGQASTSELWPKVQ